MLLSRPCIKHLSQMSMKGHAQPCCVAGLMQPAYVCLDPPPAGLGAPLGQLLYLNKGCGGLLHVWQSWRLHTFSWPHMNRLANWGTQPSTQGGVCAGMS